MNFEDCIKKRLVNKRSVDKEMADSLNSLVDIRLRNMKNLDNTTLKIESYYEVIKELLTALLSLKGYKSYSHECLILFLKDRHSKDFTTAQIELIDQLRVMRNDIAYRGFFVEEEYLTRNELQITGIIDQLKQLLKD